MRRETIWFAVVLAAMLMLAPVIWAQEVLIPVPERQLKALLAEHLQALQALQAAEDEIARLRAKLGCV